jgi:hypothetical protein
MGGDTFHGLLNVRYTHPILGLHDDRSIAARAPGKQRSILCGKFTQMFSWREQHAQLSAFIPVPDDRTETVPPMHLASMAAEG